MKLKDRASLAYKVLTQSVPTQSIGSVLRNYGKGPIYNPHKQLRGITYKAVDKIGLSVNSYMPIVNRRNGDAIENHPLYTVAMQPNPGQDGRYFHHLEAMLYEIYGETFWYLARGERTNQVKELYLLNPAQMELVFDNGELIGYVFHKTNGTNIGFELDEIIHNKRPNPFNEWRGMSIMERAAEYIDIEITTTSFTMNYMHNNASPSGIVTLPNMTKEAFKQFTQQWREGYEGPENAGKTAFVRGEGADFKAVGATLKDVDQKVTREMAKEDVLMMFDMPKGLLGGAGDKGLGRSESEALEYIFATWKIEPMMERLDGIYQKILASFRTGEGTVGHESPIPADKEYILSRNEKGVDKWITRNEARQSMGLPPLPDGDKLPPFQQQQVTPGPAKSVKRVTLKKQVKEDKVKKLNQEQEDFRSELVATTEVYATKFKSVLSKFVRNQEAEMIDKINASSKAYNEWLPDVKTQSEELAKLLTPVIIELMETQSEDVAHFITGELLTISPEIRRQVETNILQISGVFNADTIRELERTLAEGQTAGESLVKLKKRVESVYSDAKGYRAERIARTETLRASNDTAELVYKENGFTEVQWFVNPGACEFCQSFAGMTKTIGGSFLEEGDIVTGVDGGKLKIDYSDIETPPLHPNCTCSIVPGGG